MPDADTFSMLMIEPEPPEDEDAPETADNRREPPETFGQTGHVRTSPPVRSVFRVAVENVTPIWGQVEPLLTHALAGHFTHDAESIRRAILGQTAQLWVQWSDRVEALAVSEFAVYPKGIWVRIWIVAAARDAKLDDEAFLGALSQWRDMHGCKGFEAIGRHGWLKRFPDMQVVGLVMRSVV